MSAFLTYPVMGLLGAISQHLDAFEVGEPAEVRVTTTPAPGLAPVTVQLDGGARLPAIAARLLAWADTLTDVRAQAWRTPGGDSVHLDITGRLADNTTRVRVWDAVPAREVTGLGLRPRQRRTLTLGRLRAWADLTPADADDLSGGEAA